MMDLQPTESAGANEMDTTVAEAMLRVRFIDERLARLGEAGAIGFLPRALGREAALIGTLAGLRAQDWIFPTTADWALAFSRGMSIETFIHRVFGDARDPLVGRDMPAGTCAQALRIGSASAPAATHLPHAVGVAWAALQRGEDLVTAALFDAREVDAADFHTGLNFAGVMVAPTLFVCRVPRGQEGAAEHAIAYGIASDRCDGTDAAAVQRVIERGVARARDGGGATVIDLELGDADAAIDVARAAVDAQALGALEERIGAQLDAAIEAAEGCAAPDLKTLFDDVYEALPANLAAQLERARI